MIAANDQERLPPDPVDLDLMAYLDGELAPEKVAEVEERLESDPVYARKLRQLVAVADFVRDDADRIFAQKGVDSIADEVMGRLTRSSQPPSHLLPLSSVATRRKKNTVIWVSFGVVAAAAAALFVFVRAHDQQQQKIDTAEMSAQPPQKVAVKMPETPSSKEATTAIEDGAKHEVEGLEVGEGATVIYRSDSTPVVWVTKTEPSANAKSPKK